MADPNLVRCFTKTVRDMIEEVLRNATSREEYDNRVLSVRMWFGQHLDNLTFGLIKLVVEDTLDDMIHAVRERFYAADARLKNVKLEVQWRGREPIDASFEIKLDSVGPCTLLSEDNVASVLRLLKERDEGDWLLVNMEELDLFNLSQAGISGLRNMTNHADPRHTSATSPVLPPGFRNDIKFDFEKPLGPRGFFLAVAYMMGELSQWPWDSYVPKVGIAENSGVVVIVRPAAPSRLLVSHAALGLNALAVTTVTVPIFHRGKNTMSLLGTALGDIEILPRDMLPGKYQVTSGSESNLTTNNSGESGTIVDPATAKYKIGYDLNGSKTNSRDIFTAVLDGLMIIAQYDRARRCEALQAVGPLSATGQAVITIQEVSGSRELTYGLVAKALLLIFEYCVSQNKFNEMDFEMFWDGEKIGAGYCLKLGPISSGEQTIA